VNVHGGLVTGESSLRGCVAHGGWLRFQMPNEPPELFSRQREADDPLVCHGATVPAGVTNALAREVARVPIIERRRIELTGWFS
jgi:hypothetical protein